MSWIKDISNVFAPGAYDAIEKYTSGRPQGTTQPGNAQRDKAMQDYMDALADFEKNGNNQYQWLGDFQGGPNQATTEMGKISIDPRYGQYERQALQDLEQQSKDGLSMRDQADLAQLEGQVNRQNAGRQGAIQQNMAARGMGGSGMELVQQMQASQDATERQALASMEKAAMAQEGRRGATAMLGQQAGQMSARDYQQQAQKANAQDAINRFNTANQQNTAQMNWQGRQGIANQNTNQNNQFANQKLGGRQGAAQVGYNAGTDKNNMAAGQDAAQTAQKSQIAGAVIKGAGMAYGMSNGGVVPGQAPVPGDHPANDVVPTMLSPGEVVIPRTQAKQILPLMDRTNERDHGNDAIDSLLKAMASMQKKGKQ